MNLPQKGLILVLKKECPTCTLIEPVYRQIRDSKMLLTVISQDNPEFPEGMDVVDDTGLEKSFHLDIEVVPTLISVSGGREQSRTSGWVKEEWIELTGIADLGQSLPDLRPGCGSITVEPGMPEKLRIKYGGVELSSRRLKITALEDEIEACYDRGWSDGLPLVPPTPERVLRMLDGTQRSPSEIIGVIPPVLAECTVEKAAINAVMAGCKPEYLPVVLAAVEAACLDEFCMHGLLATTWFSGPVVIVNGPISRAIGMNSGGNALGQGNRANATIGRALQLIIRNVGGGKPGGVDRATLGNPGKYTFCFSEKEDNPKWQTLAQEKGFEKDSSTVSLFAGDGVQGFVDQLSRTPDSLARSLSKSLLAVANHKFVMAADALVVLSPEHFKIFDRAGWDKARIKAELYSLLDRPGQEVVRGADDILEGIPEDFASVDRLPKFRPDGLILVHAGGDAGMFSAIIGGWIASGPKGSQLVTKEIVL
ncbi:MAG: thioredoxin [Proteobacteria bacterium]|nr:thioredoxin [Pseudomonadota bacterium]